MTDVGVTALDAVCACSAEVSAIATQAGSNARCNRRTVVAPEKGTATFFGSRKKVSVPVFCDRVK
jgi:hypothetical protein